MDVSPNQLVSVAASLIPFLEHDDANRALMGSNMQRQAVPLIRTTSPLVGTAWRASSPATPASPSSPSATASSSRSTRPASSSVRRRSTRSDPTVGQARHLQPDQVPALEPEHLHATRSRSSSAGDTVKAGDVIADGPATETRRARARPERGRRVHAVEGYNFEDSILISERLVKDDVFTSIHIEEFECVARDTKLGKEEITRDIPNVGEEALKDLDESGIVRIGAEVKPGDILVGKITPKGETQLSPEEKLLRAIFGEKAGDVRDSSLRVPPGVTASSSTPACSRARAPRRTSAPRTSRTPRRRSSSRDQRDEVKIISESYYTKMRELLVGKTTAVAPRRRQGQGPRCQRARRSTREHARRGPAHATGTRSRSTRATARSRSSSSSSRAKRRGGRPRHRGAVLARRSPSSPRATSCRRASSRW